MTPLSLHFAKKIFLKLIVVEPREICLKVPLYSDLEFINVQPHNSKKSITYSAKGLPHWRQSNAYNVILTTLLYLTPRKCNTVLYSLGRREHFATHVCMSVYPLSCL